VRSRKTCAHFLELHRAALFGAAFAAATPPRAERWLPVRAIGFPQSASASARPPASASNTAPLSVRRAALGLAFAHRSLRASLFFERCGRLGLVTHQAELFFEAGVISRGRGPPLRARAAALCLLAENPRRRCRCCAATARARAWRSASALTRDSSSFSRASASALTRATSDSAPGPRLLRHARLTISAPSRSGSISFCVSSCAPRLGGFLAEALELGEQTSFGFGAHARDFAFERPRGL
jgi:hypothetical protein